MKKIGLITITYNSAHVIEPFMECVLRQTHSNFILYIIDNISSDNTLELIQKFSDHRIVVLAKDGKFEKQYMDEDKTKWVDLKDFTITTDEKTMYLLVGTKVLEVTL